jgi:hypothetical protein
VAQSVSHYWTLGKLTSHFQECSYFPDGFLRPGSGGAISDRAASNFLERGHDAPLWLLPSILYRQGECGIMRVLDKRLKV